MNSYTAEDLPNYYKDFIKQAEKVRKHLDNIDEPEIKPVPAVTSGAQLGAEVTLAFAKAAHRHRHEPADATPVGTPPGSATEPPRVL
ncbi:MAG TPA: hypothetical protein VLJ59_17775 [Mycobacteriales bacterium]|nr:hypothetical protein [Mycobacteriales bacterium]